MDALEYLLVGASTVQVTTGVIHYGYRIVADMIEGLSDYLSARGDRRACGTWWARRCPICRRPTTST